MPSRIVKDINSRLVGSSSAMASVKTLICSVAASDITVLLQGESGTGKEVAARLIHDLSVRSSAPFVPINCGAIPSELLESELFGHEKGAFTGASASRKGRFELAEGGTLFLDEIGDMPFPMQVKLLRVLQEQTYERVGGSAVKTCNVRVIAATHQDLEKKISDSSFREDLFYRLSVFPIDLPPLRARHGDITELVELFSEKAKSSGRPNVSFDGEAISSLNSYQWPGNVRELFNLVERLTVLRPNEIISLRDLPAKYQSTDDGTTEKSLFIPSSNQLDLLAAPDLTSLFPPAAPLESDGSSQPEIQIPINLKQHLAEYERELIIGALEKNDWVIAKAAKWLHLQRTTLVEKMKKYKITRGEVIRDLGESP